jgi:hypothetical protein
VRCPALRQLDNIGTESYTPHIRCALISAIHSSQTPVSSPVPDRPNEARPAPPSEGALYIDKTGLLWKVTRITMAAEPAGFYLVHLCNGRTLSTLQTSVVLGPREFATLAAGLQLV